MDETTAQTLGDKLTSLDLTTDEATMLAMLIGGSVEEAEGEAEVSGFHHIETTQKIGVGELQECTISKASPLRAAVGIRIAPPVHNWSFGATQNG